MTRRKGVALKVISDDLPETVAFDHTRRGHPPRALRYTAACASSKEAIMPA
jgi:hypothetical protein